MFALVLVVMSAVGGEATPSVEVTTPVAAPATNHVSINVLAPLAGIAISIATTQDVVPISVEYERRISPSWTVYGAPGFVIGSMFGRVVGGGSLGLGARFFFSKNALSGFSVGPDVAGTLMGGLGARLWSLSLGGYGGYHFHFDSGVILALGIGAYWRAGTLGVGFLPTARAAIGYAF